MRVTLAELTVENMEGCLKLEVSTEQREFVPSAAGIIARAWTVRDSAANLFVIEADGTAVGMALVYELNEEPSCYFLMEMFVDARYQRRGIGSEALRRIVKRYAESPKFPMIELAVDRRNTAAIGMYLEAGFEDTGYTDPDCPQYLNLAYYFVKNSA